MSAMRTREMPGYPDPTFGAGGSAGTKITKSDGVDPSSPQFQSAQKACQQKAGLPGRPRSGQGLNSSGGTS